MSLLTVILLPVLLLLGAAAVQVIHDSLSKRAQADVCTQLNLDHPGTNNNHEVRSIVSLADAFEPESAPLWDPVDALLHFVADGGADGRSVACLLPFYSTLTAQYPEMFEGIPLSATLAFLRQEGLTAVREGEVRLTAAGSEFLKARAASTTRELHDALSRN